MCGQIKHEIEKVAQSIERNRQKPSYRQTPTKTLHKKTIQSQIQSFVRKTQHFLLILQFRSNNSKKPQNIHLDVEIPLVELSRKEASYIASYKSNCRCIVSCLPSIYQERSLHALDPILDAQLASCITHIASYKSNSRRIATQPTQLVTYSILFQTKLFV